MPGGACFIRILIVTDFGSPSAWIVVSMADIFISYAKKDRPYAEELAKFLDELGLTTWWDANLVGGQEFRERITDEIDRSKATIVIWSPNSIKSAFVIDEADHARQSGKLLSAIAPGFKADRIPIGFRGSQVVSIGEGDQLVQALDRGRRRRHQTNRKLSARDLREADQDDRTKYAKDTTACVCRFRGCFARRRDICHESVAATTPAHRQHLYID